MSGYERILVESFHDPLRLGHYIVYKILEQERSRFFEQIINDYNIKGMDEYELRQIIESPHYLQLTFPKTNDENYEALLAHASRKRRMVS